MTDGNGQRAKPANSGPPGSSRQTAKRGRSLFILCFAIAPLVLMTANVTGVCVWAGHVMTEEEITSLVVLHRLSPQRPSATLNEYSRDLSLRKFAADFKAANPNCCSVSWGENPYGDPAVILFLSRATTGWPATVVRTNFPGYQWPSNYLIPSTYLVSNCGVVFDYDTR